MVKNISTVFIDKKSLDSMGSKITQYNSIFLSEHLKGSSWKPQNRDSGVALIQITKSK